MAGFFTKKQGKSISRPEGKVHSCVSCGLYKKAKMKKQQPVGEFKKGIMNIWENPEDFFQNKGIKREYSAMYSDNGVHIMRDCINVFAIGCSVKKAEPKHTTACRKYVMQAIRLYKPRVIILHGQQALRSVIGNYWKKNLGTIDKWRGYVIPLRELNAYVIPMINAYKILSEKERDFVRLTLENDIERALSYHKKEFPVFENEEEQVIILDDDKDIKKELEEFKKHDGFISYDYETTGLKPEAEWHELLCISIATKDRCVSFLTNTTKRKMLVKKFLSTKGLMLTSHNMKFEYKWDKCKLKVDTKYAWDSLMGAHMLDNRSGVTSLKFQTLVQLGVADYDSVMEEWIGATTTEKNEHGANAENRMREMLKKGLVKECLTYCGCDSIFQNKIAYKQIEEMGISLHDLKDLVI